MEKLSDPTAEEQLFTEWQDRLFRFVYENKRKFTEAEWQWMRHQFEIEHFFAGEDAPPAMAADGDCDVHAVDVKSLQKRLVGFGAYLPNAEC